MTNQTTETSFVATIGMFDGVHRGHKCLIEQVMRTAAERSMRPMLVTMDEHPCTVVTGEAKPLLTTCDERVSLLRRFAACRIETLHFTHEMAAMTATEFMREVLVPMGVRVLVMGYDHRFGHTPPTATFDDYVEWGRANGIEVVRATALEDEKVSSSLIRKALAAGDMDTASRLLGRAYSISGTVVEGMQIGRSLGFPTANLRLSDNRKMLPADGVYAVEVTVGDSRQTMRGMTNIGLRPTIDDSPRRTIETHIFGLDHDIYAQPLTIAFVRKIRDTRTFDTREQLADQLRRDAQACLI